MKVVIDMNLSPKWREILEQAGHEARHWSEIGAPNASDSEIMEWARRNGFVVFTHDLDYGTLLAVTGAENPSVIQIREQDVRPGVMGEVLVKVLTQANAEIEKGALVTIEKHRHRVRILPLRPFQ